MVPYSLFVRLLLLVHADVALLIVMSCRVLYMICCCGWQFPVAILGYLLLPSTKIGLTQWEFIAVNILGGFIYSYAKIKVCRYRRRRCCCVRDAQM